MSIRHVVSWKLAATDEAERLEHAAGIRSRLLALRDVIPEIIDIEVGHNLVAPGRNWDVALVAEYADLAALDRYQKHPAHLEVVAYVSQVVSERAAVDFEI